MAEKVRVAKKSDISEGGMKKVEAKGRVILLANISGEIFAINNTCSHRGGPLDEGTLEDATVTCPWHAAKFDTRTGKVSSETPWAHDQEKFPVILEGEDVFVEI